MDPDFWHQKWQSGQIGFHKTSVNRLLVQFFPELGLEPGQRVFIPLCGKTVDIGWLLERGYQVAGAELNETAISELFAGLGLTPEITEDGPVKRYQADNIELFAGDIFDLTADRLGAVDAVYDRAALVALPQAMRRRYTAHLAELTDYAPQLLLCFEYDQSQMDGPPFSIIPAEVERHYGHCYTPQLLSSTAMNGKLKGQVEAVDHVWLIERR